MIWFVYAILCALFSSLATLLQKKTLQEIHAIDFSVMISFCAALMTMPAFFLYSSSTITPLIIGLAIGESLITATAYYWMARSVRHLPISVSSPLILFGPFITTFLAYIILGEAITVIQCSGIALLLVGLYVLETRTLLAWRDLYEHVVKNVYTKLVFGSIVLYGFSALIDRMVLGHMHMPPLQYLSLTQIGVAGWMLMIATIDRSRSLREISKLFSRIWYWIVLIAFLTCAYRFFGATAISIAPVGLVDAVKRSSILVTTIIGGEMFHESDLMRKGIACAIMLFGLYLLTF